MLVILRLVLAYVKYQLCGPAGLLLENAALRQQLAVYERNAKRPRLKRRDRVFWVWLSRCWKDWKSALVIVQPATVVGWHRAGFQIYWRLQSHPSGRPRVEPDLQQLIRRMSRENPLWGAPRIQAELKLLGHQLAESSVAKYMIRQGSHRPPSPSWKTFLNTHASEIAACDFFTIPTVTFRVLYCFVVLSHDRRRIVHFNVTEHPTAAWAAQQITEAFPFDSAPEYLLRDNDSIYGQVFRERVRSLGIKDERTAFRSPWQNAYCERVIGTLRRECLDHMIVFGEGHLKRITTDYFSYYNEHRAHQSLDGDAPNGREVESKGEGDIVAVPMVGGLHHRYTRVAA